MRNLAKKYFSVKDFYFKSNSSFKKAILFLLFLLMFISFDLFNISYNSPLFWEFVVAYILIFFFIFPDNSIEVGKIVLNAALVLAIIVMIFAWLGEGNLPYTNLNVDNNAMLVLFTIILAIATIINTITNRQIVGFSRLSEVNFYINPILCVIVENKGKYPVRRIKLTTEIREKMKSKGGLKRRLGDLFLSPEDEKHYLPSKENYVVDLRDYLKKRFKLKFDHDMQQYTSIKEKSFKIKLTLDYYSDNLFKNPLPIFKEFDIKVGPDGTTRKEVKPSS